MSTAATRGLTLADVLRQLGGISAKRIRRAADYGPTKALACCPAFAAVALAS
jgi:hypothetical protein